MSQGRFTDKLGMFRFRFNPKCVWFSVIMMAAYWLVAGNPNPLLLPVIGAGAYIAMGWYDFRYNCDSLLIGSGHTTIFKPAPTTVQHTAKHNVDPSIKMSQDQERSFARQVNLFHVMIIAPLLLYVAYMGTQSDSRVFGVVFAMGVLTLLYHGGRFWFPRKRNSVFTF